MVMHYVLVFQIIHFFSQIATIGNGMNLEPLMHVKEIVRMRL